jgi:hypothetical protein
MQLALAVVCATPRCRSPAVSLQGPALERVMGAQVLCDFAGGSLSLFQLCLEVRVAPLQ